MPTIKTRDGCSLFVKDWGEGMPVILIHGWPLSADTWDSIAMSLAESGFRAITYDRRGFGRSDQPWKGYDYDTLSDDLADVMTETGASQDATIVGFSMGGGEVARYMSRHGGKGLRAAALVSSIVPFMLKTDDNTAGVPQAQFDKMAASMRIDRPQFMIDFLRTFFGVGVITSPVSEGTLSWAWHQCIMAGLMPTLACAEAFATTDFRGELSSFRVPTLIIHGTSDAVVPIDASARPAAKAIAGAKLIEYSGAPHGLFATNGGDLSRDLRDYLRANR